MRFPDDRLAMAAEDLERGLLNLFRNAVHAMSIGGTLTTSTGSCLRGLPPAPRVVPTVSATGCGMAPEMLARVFTPGFSTGARRGTGLRLVSKHQCGHRAGGAVHVASTPGQDTFFTLTRRPLSDGQPTTAVYGLLQRSATLKAVRARSSAG